METVLGDLSITAESYPVVVGEKLSWAVSALRRMMSESGLSLAQRHAGSTEDTLYTNLK